MKNENFVRWHGECHRILRCFSNHRNAHFPITLNTFPNSIICRPWLSWKFRSFGTVSAYESTSSHVLTIFIRQVDGCVRSVWTRRATHHQHDVPFFRWNDGSVRHVHTTFWIFKYRSTNRRHYKNETDWNQMWFFSDDQKQLADKYVICGNFGFSNATVQSNRHPHQPNKMVYFSWRIFGPIFCNVLFCCEWETCVAKTYHEFT